MIKNEHMDVIVILASCFSACSPQYDAEERITSLEQPHSAPNRISQTLKYGFFR
jgi:hypothetical protein